MSRIEPILRENIPNDAKPILEFSEQVMGFTANDVLTMAHWPELLQAMQPMVGLIYGPGEIDAGLKRLIALVVSTAAGCRYCQAHTAHGAHMIEVDDAKIAAAWEFETNDLFNAAERVALRVAQNAGLSPNQVSDANFEELRRYYTDRQCLEIVAVVSMFGFLNRWNSTLATQIEAEPNRQATELLSDFKT